jgi:DMSO/TMAO reductase YedYZ molybdopterin-dependent catalytic subunit
MSTTSPQARAAIRPPRPAVAAPRLPAGTSLNIPGITPFVTPDDSFYRVDIALLARQVNPATWQLRIHGMVQREITISYAELLRRPLIEAYVTLTCVSDPVGGPYAGNAKWLGAKLADLIRRARPLAGANQLLSTSVHGFPVRMVVPGLYGYVPRPSGSPISRSPRSPPLLPTGRSTAGHSRGLLTESRIDVPAPARRSPPGR